MYALSTEFCDEMDPKGKQVCGIVQESVVHANFVLNSSKM